MAILKLNCTALYNNVVSVQWNGDKTESFRILVFILKVRIILRITLDSASLTRRK